MFGIKTFFPRLLKNGYIFFSNYTVGSRFSFKRKLVRKIRTGSGGNYRDVRQTEGSGNRDSTVNVFCFSSRNSLSHSSEEEESIYFTKTGNFKVLFS